MSASTEPRDERALYIQGMRDLMDALEASPSIPLPYQGRADTIALTFHFLNGADPRAEMAAAARALPCDFRKEPKDYGDVSYLDLAGAIRGVRIRLVAYRDAVCTRVVTGTREVTRTVQDPEALAQVPEVEITETVEDVTWECGSLLAPAADDAPAEVSAA
jgi:hypothetical protein